MNAICQICLESYNILEDKLITCTNCIQTVHQSCYGSLDTKKNSEWICDSCNYLLSNPHSHCKCEFCPIMDQGPLKQLKVIDDDNEIWAHIQCVNWIPELRFIDEKYY